MFDSKWFVDHEVKLPLDEQQDRILRKRPNPADLNLAVERPFINFFRADLINFISTALNRPHPAIELATLALEEARLRFQKSKPRKLKEITKLFKDSEISPINWLANARHAVKEYKNKEVRETPGAGVVYFVLIKGYTARNGTYGCYVGESKTTEMAGFENRQEARIAQHFQDKNTNRRVNPKGVEPLWSLNCFSDDLKWDRPTLLKHETGFNKALQEVVPRVLGNLTE